MPELPEVETIRRDLEKALLHKTFSQIEVIDPFVLRTPQDKFIDALKKKSVEAIDRRGKALIVTCVGRDKVYLVVQLMMTGQLIIEGVPDKHTRIIFHVGNGRDRSLMLYNDQRRFGQLRVVKDLSDVKHLSLLGPEPFDAAFNPKYILEYTRHSKRPIKNLLLDHTFVAGIGNIYACEILFRCGLSPKRLAGRLSLAQAKDIHQYSIQVLNEAIEARGSSMRNYRDASGQEGGFKKLIRVYAREGENCPRCQSPIQRTVQAGRSTFYCPQCQK
ncbi:MAG: bifunctional DNA-formamidopyrimidine glycosylase/DNA-(apurinic or apyrimidinic site) lyase [Candidatus Omnitrophica bacterium]|nr:bifunctional DNA-formamidopyrimidine glycosylase/DNA-(apurinic or apyrimidinic site) lyase [Candidatus Omnitrophota bacterium]